MLEPLSPFPAPVVNSAPLPLLVSELHPGLRSLVFQLEGVGEQEVLERLQKSDALTRLEIARSLPQAAITDAVMQAFVSKGEGLPMLALNPNLTSPQGARLFGLLVRALLRERSASWLSTHSPLAATLDLLALRGFALPPSALREVLEALESRERRGEAWHVLLRIPSGLVSAEVLLRAWTLMENVSPAREQVLGHPAADAALYREVAQRARSEIASLVPLPGRSAEPLEPTVRLLERLAGIENAVRDPVVSEILEESGLPAVMAQAALLSPPERFAALWSRLLPMEEGAEWAVWLLERGSEEQRQRLAEAERVVLLQHPSAELRLRVIRLFGREQDAAEESR